MWFISMKEARLECQPICCLKLLQFCVSAWFVVTVKPLDSSYNINFCTLSNIKNLLLLWHKLSWPACIMFQYYVLFIYVYHKSDMIKSTIDIPNYSQVDLPQGTNSQFLPLLLEGQNLFYLFYLFTYFTIFYLFYSQRNDKGFFGTLIPLKG